MILQYSALAADLERIRRFLESASKQQQTPDQRRFAYIACISALYSSFENYAERVAFRFGEMLLAQSSNVTPEQLSNLRRRYVRNASVLLNQSLGAGRYREVTEFDVAKSLASCLDNSTPSFDLRLELIALHSSNLRLDALCELYQWAVSDLQDKIARSDAVDSWGSRAENANARTLKDVLRNELDDLVERRNEVAHRAIPDEILSYERLLAMIDFIEAISLGLIATLATPLLEASIKDGGTASLGIPNECFQKNRVAIIPSLESAVSTGDYIIQPGVTSTRWGRVLGIQMNDKPVPRADAGTEVGLLFDFQVRKKTKILLWHTPNPELTAPPDNIFGSHGPLEAAD